MTAVRGRTAGFVLGVVAALGSFVVPAQSQLSEETLSGPDIHETGQGPHGHLFGDWGGLRARLLERGVRFDFQYLSDSLWNIQGDRKERFASWNRFRGTVDMDLGALSGYSNLYFHATALWQGGGNLGTYLGSLTSPSRMSSANTFRLDSWWLEKRWLNERVTARIGAIRISWGILAGSVARVTVQSTVLFALLRVLHVNSPFARETLVCCSFPLANTVVLFAARYKSSEAETSSMLLISTVALAVTVPGMLWLSN
jgi:hypothetical protein